MQMYSTLQSWSSSCQNVVWAASVGGTDAAALLVVSVSRCDAVGTAAKGVVLAGRLATLEIGAQR
jgi:hypothetical protein